MGRHNSDRIKGEAEEPAPKICGFEWITGDGIAVKKRMHDCKKKVHSSLNIHHGPHVCRQCGTTKPS